MRINDQSGELDMHRTTIGMQAIIRDVLAAEGFWGGAQLRLNPRGKEDRCLL
jgi:hypothetical protein